MAATIIIIFNRIAKFKPPIVHPERFSAKSVQRDVVAHRVVEEEEATEEAEQVRCEQREVDYCGAGQPHYRGHDAVEGVHAERVAHEKHH